MFKNKSMIVLLILLITATTFFAACGNEDEGVAVAKVNDENINEEELDNYLDYRKKEAELSGYIAPEMWDQVIEGSDFTYEQQLKQASLQDLVNQEVLLQRADEEDIKVDDKEIDKELEEFRGTEEKEKNFNEYLEQLGISEEYFVDMYRQGMRINKLMDSLIDVDEKALKKEYEENKEAYDKIKVSHILVEKKDKAEEIKSKIDSGEDFDKLAKENSTEPNAEQSAGDLGFIGKDAQLVPEFKEAAFKLEKGEVSNPVKTDFGYHIIKITDEKKGFEANKEEVKENLKGSKYNEKAQEIVSEADTEILIDFEKEAEENKEKEEEKKDSNDAETDKKDTENKEEQDENSDVEEKSTEEETE